MDSTVVIDCPICAVRVNAMVRGAVHDEDSEAAVVLACCPACHGPLFGITQVSFGHDNQYFYDSAERLWPEPATIEIHTSIPETVRRDIKNAQKCIANGIYSAAVVLCGRALEQLVKEKGTSSKTLADGLADLKAKGVIDERLSLWASALRRERNIGAHATDEDVSKENAQDVLDFTIAIFEYVYTLTEKYEKFVARKTRPKSNC